MSITGLPGQGPVRVGIPVADLSAGLFCAHRHPDRAARARSVRRGAMGHHLAAAGADLHARLPGRALAADGTRWPSRPATITRPDPDRRVQDQGRPHQHRRRRPGDVGARLPGDRGARSWSTIPTTRPARCARRTATRSMPRSRSASINKTSAEWIDIFNKAGVPCGPIYSIDQVFADPQVKHLGIAQSAKRPDGSDADLCRPAGRRCRARRARSSSRRPSRASTPTRCSRNSASPTTRSPICTRARRCDAATVERRTCAMNVATTTDKMLSRKEGGVGYLIFNNPERHNAVSLEMWEAASGILEDFADRQGRPRRRADRRRRQGLRLGRRHLQVREGALQQGSDRPLQRRRRSRPTPRSTNFPKPTIAMIRGYCIGGGMGLALCCDLRICSDNSKFAVPAAKLGLGYGYQGHQEAGRRGRPVLRQGDLLHRAPVHRRRGADDGPGQPRGAGATSSKATCKNYADTIAGNAPLTVNSVKYIVGEDGEGESERDLKNVRRAGERMLRQRTTTPKAARPSWKSASRSSPALTGLTPVSPCIPEYTCRR